MDGPPYDPGTSEHVHPLPARAAPPPPLLVRSSGRSDAGKVRAANEDDFLIAELTRTIRVRQSRLPQPAVQDSDTRAQVFIVADGMGGHRAGEIASLVAVDAVEDYLLNALRRWTADDGELMDGLREALLRADARVIAEAQHDPGRWGMGTTLTMAFCLGRQAVVAHVGDSRCYHFRAGRLTQITQDHTAVADWVRAGQMTPEEAAEHRLRHVIMNCLGGDRVGASVELHRLELAAGDALLLCTDGLTEMIADDQIREILAAEADPEAATKWLISAANGAGGRDNVTAIVARFDAAE